MLLYIRSKDIAYYIQRMYIDVYKIDSTDFMRVHT